jgi:serine/threonine protein kinase
MTADLSVDKLCELLVRTGLLMVDDVREQRERWLADGGTADDAAAFCKWLTARGALTEYQADRLLRGQTSHYFFGDYKLLDRIGTGLMAGVFKAVHTVGHVVAIKVLPPSKAKDPQAFGRFQREARLALQLKHPNIVRTFQTGEADGLHYLVMEYLDGETLDEVLARRGKLPVREALRLIHQGLCGLQHIHEQGMIHRDLKPGNLMVVPAAAPGSPDTTLQGSLKILDIGVGRAVFDEGGPGGEQQEDLTVRGDQLGAPDYRAAEQTRDAHCADVRSDLYSLGCVLYHLLTGQPPFPGGNAVQKAIRHAREAPRPLKEFDPMMPASVQAVIDRLLAKDPAMRFATPDQAAAVVEEARGGKEPAAPPGPKGTLESYEIWLENADVQRHGPPPVRKPAVPPRPAAKAPRPLPASALESSPRQWWKVLATVGVVLLLGTGVVALLTRLRHQPPPSPTTPGGNQAETFDKWTRRVAALPPDAQMAAIAERLKAHNPEFDGRLKETVRKAKAGENPEVEGSGTYTVQDGKVVEVYLSADSITDLSPLRSLSTLQGLVCTGSAPGKGRLADLTPLRGMPLAVLDVSSTRVSDLTPLEGIPLLFLGIAGTQVRDLAPLEGMPLLALHCAGIPAGDLGALRGMLLTYLDAGGLPVEDLSPLRGMKLEALWAPVRPERDAALLRSIASLKEVNGRPVAEMYREADAARRRSQDWAAQVASLPLDAQAAAVEKRMKEVNPGFSGLKSRTQGGAIIEVRFVCDDVLDLSPLRALPKLQRLFCHGRAPGKGRLSDLSPLGGLPLVELDCASAQVTDLNPLQKMPLQRLNLSGNTRLSDLGPLAGLRLERLDISSTHVADLKPLQGMPLQYLFAHDTQVHDFFPLRKLPLKALTCDIEPARDREVLDALEGLEQFNNRPVAEFRTAQRAFDTWVQDVTETPPEKQVAAVGKKLQELNPGFDGNFTPRIEGGAVTEITLVADAIKNLAPLRALPKLKKLTCSGSAALKSKLADLWPLKRLPLQHLAVANTAVRDLAPLRGMPLESLDLRATRVTDLGPVAQGSLKSLNIRDTRVTDFAALEGIPLRSLEADLDANRDGHMLQGMRTLAMVNGQPKADFLKAAVGAETATTQPAARPGQPLPRPSARFIGKVQGVNRTEQRFTLQLTQSIVVVNTYHAAWLAHHELKLLEAPRIRNPIDRIRFVQEHAFWIAYHQQHFYERHDQRQQLEVHGAEDLKVRVASPPPVFDDKGRPRKPTPKELEEMRGPDLRLPGYTASFADLRNNQMVDVYLAQVDPDKFKLEKITPKTEKPVLPPVRAVVVVILQDAL